MTLSAAVCFGVLAFFGGLLAGVGALMAVVEWDDGVSIEGKVVLASAAFCSATAFWLLVFAS